MGNLNLNPTLLIERDLKSQLFIGSHIYSPRYDEHTMTWQSKDIVTWPSEKNNNVVPDMPILQDDWALDDPFEQIHQSVIPVSKFKIV